LSVSLIILQKTQKPIFSLFVISIVSSRTLWLGHLPKMISEIELREQLEPHGEINDINVNLILNKIIF
jgi:hypothetical protein